MQRPLKTVILYSTQWVGKYVHAPYPCGIWGPAHKHFQNIYLMFLQIPTKVKWMKNQESDCITLVLVHLINHQLPRIINFFMFF